jgi:mannitol/fructose-specific phosphotransferase system IIA component (Ntr-type)
VQATTLFAGAVALSDWDYRLEHAQAVRSGLPVPAEATPAGLFDALRDQCDGIPLALRRGGHYEPFHTDSVLGPADRVIVLQRATSYPDALDRFDRMVTRCPVLDIAQALDRDTFIEAAAGLLAEPLELSTATLATQMHRSVARGTTVLLPGLAVPHIVVEGRQSYAMLMARCRAGIEFPGEPESVHTLFVLAGTADERRFHLQALAAIAQVVQRPGFEQEWLLASGPEALRRLVLQAERRRYPAPPSDRLEAGIAAPADGRDATLL